MARAAVEDAKQVSRTFTIVKSLVLLSSLLVPSVSQSTSLGPRVISVLHRHTLLLEIIATMRAIRCSEQFLSIPAIRRLAKCSCESYDVIVWHHLRPLLQKRKSTNQS
jgi:hypothetical protein